MHREARGKAAVNIGVHAISGERNTPHRRFLGSHLLHEIESTAIGQADVGNQEIERLARHELARVLERTGRAHIVAAVSEQGRQGLAARFVILHQQELAEDVRLGRLDRDRFLRERQQPGFDRPSRSQRQLDLKRGAQPGALAAGTQAAAVTLDETAGNCQAEAQPTEAVGASHRVIALGKRVVDPVQLGRGKTDAAVGDGDHCHLIRRTQMQTHGDPAVVGRELDRVFQDIPKNLLQAHRISRYLSRKFSQLQTEIDLLLLDISLHGRQRILQYPAQIHGHQVERHLAMGDAREIQQIVDQAGFQFHILANGGENLPRLLAKRRIGRRLARQQQHRVERRAQFVGKCGEESVLRAAGTLRRIARLAQRRGAGLDPRLQRVIGLPQRPLGRRPLRHFAFEGRMASAQGRGFAI